MNRCTVSVTSLIKSVAAVLVLLWLVFLGLGYLIGSNAVRQGCAKVVAHG
jgi:hypothetical protein